MDLDGLSVDDLLDPIPLGILLGLFVGKQVGVFAFAWIAVKSGSRATAGGVTFGQVYGAAVLCGIGFTMSLFIGMLAFENAAAGEVIVTDRLGILAGTFLSAIVGSLVLHWLLPRAGSGEQVVEQDAAEHREPEQVVVQERAEAVARVAVADQVLLVHAARGGDGQPEPVPVGQVARAGPRRRAAPAAANCRAATMPRSARPNRIADERTPMTRSSSRSTIA